MLIRVLGAADARWKEAALCRAWGSTAVARKGELVDAATLPGFVADLDGSPAGLLTYARRGRELEIVSIQVEEEGCGLGRALMDAAHAHAVEAGVDRIWLVTTNNNTRAIRFYQRWGMDLVAFIRDGVAESRRVKPTIPTTDTNGIPIRHEFEFELRLGS